MVRNITRIVIGSFVVVCYSVGVLLGDVTPANKADEAAKEVAQHWITTTKKMITDWPHDSDNDRRYLRICTRGWSRMAGCYGVLGDVDAYRAAEKEATQLLDAYRRLAPNAALYEHDLTLARIQGGEIAKAADSAATPYSDSSGLTEQRALAIAYLRRGQQDEYQAALKKVRAHHAALVEGHTMAAYATEPELIKLAIDQYRVGDVAGSAKTSELLQLPYTKVMYQSTMARFHAREGRKDIGEQILKQLEEYLPKAIDTDPEGDFEGVVSHMKLQAIYAQAELWGAGDFETRIQVEIGEPGRNIGLGFTGVALIRAGRQDEGRALVRKALRRFKEKVSESPEVDSVTALVHELASAGEYEFFDDCVEMFEVDWHKLEVAASIAQAMAKRVADLGNQ